MLATHLEKLITDTIVKKISPAFILLFGSYAKGTNHRESDIDIAFFGGKELSSYERLLLASELSGKVQTEVDLVDLREIDTVFTMQIFAHGIPIYLADANEFTRQKMRAYSMYVDLNEQRKPVLDAIYRRGSVFGDE